MHFDANYKLFLFAFFIYHTYTTNRKKTLKISFYSMFTWLLLQIYVIKHDYVTNFHQKACTYKKSAVSLHCDFFIVLDLRLTKKIGRLP